ncbi:SLC13 family permease [Francisella hispaniensis]|uniref:Anion transporter n=1 Tax=Francisella hispaniensis FSC454 TaxID=1088883 RepID=A0AAC9J672_9GAMM|nr:SLC13 family permease [Francisella hispaniensis]APD49957.1 anion transporter [Francisella hispaniensis FSC454]KYW86255.1 anion transporter [Francisella hispaniensis FSC454]
MIIPIIVLIGVFILIAIRQIGNIKLQIWQIMLLGAIIVLITRQISVADALKSINLDVMMFLFSMFVIGVALEESGYLSFLSYKIFKRAKNINQLLLYILFGAGLASAVVMNDTLAIIGTPMLLLVARKYAINPKVLLLTLAFAVTIGSVMSPLGNPQNFLIATQAGLDNSFITFFRYLFIPTLINLFAAFLLIKIFYKKQLNNDYQLNNHTYESIKDPYLALLVKVSLAILLCLILIKIILAFLHLQIQIKLVYITVIAALPILFFSKSRLRIITKVDWHSLIFFAAMFILMASVWQSGFFQLVINNLDINLISIPVILVVSVVLSQLISNVPLVAIYLPLLSHLGATDKEIMVLAAASTIAGNLLILGAASNIIIIHNAEKKAAITITFLEFAKIGIPMTIINIFIYWIFLA